MERSRLVNHLATAKKEAAFYERVTFPLVYDHLKFGFYKADGSGVYWFSEFTNDGLTYLLYRLGKYVDRDKAHDLHEHNKLEFVEYINAMRLWQETEKPRQKNKILYLALTDAGFGTKCWGILTHYNAVSNASVVERVIDSPIATKVTKIEYWLPKYLKIYCHSRFLIGKKLSFGLAIVNGETGHYTLGYHLYVASDDYAFMFPMKLKKRHLSRVGEVNESLETVMQAANAVEVEQVIKNTSASVFIDTLPEKLMAKLTGLSIYRTLTCEALIDYLTYLREERGYKTVVNETLDVIFNQAFVLATR